MRLLLCLTLLAAAQTLARASDAPLAPSGAHEHRSPELPNAGESCSCSATSKDLLGDCVLKDGSGGCLLHKKSSTRCTLWKCPGPAEHAHAAATAVAVHSGKPCVGADAVLASLPEAPALPGELDECAQWEETARIDFSLKDAQGYADCSHPRVERSLRCKARLCGDTSVIDETHPPKGLKCECSEKDVSYFWVGREEKAGAALRLEPTAHCWHWHCHKDGAPGKR